MQTRPAPHPHLVHRAHAPEPAARAITKDVMVAVVAAVAASPVEPVAHSIVAGLFHMGAHGVVIVASTFLGGS